MVLRINYIPLLLSWVTGVSLDLYYVVPLHTVGFFMTLITCRLAFFLQERLEAEYDKSRIAAIAIFLLVQVLLYETKAVNFLLFFSKEIHVCFQIDKYSAWFGIVFGYTMKRISVYMSWAYGREFRPVTAWGQRLGGVVMNIVTKSSEEEEITETRHTENRLKTSTEEVLWHDEYKEVFLNNDRFFFAGEANTILQKKTFNSLSIMLKNTPDVFPFYNNAEHFFDASPMLRRNIGYAKIILRDPVEKMLKCCSTNSASMGLAFLIIVVSVKCMIGNQGCFSQKLQQFLDNYDELIGHLDFIVYRNISRVLFDSLVEPKCGEETSAIRNAFDKSLQRAYNDDKLRDAIAAKINRPCRYQEYYKRFTLPLFLEKKTTRKKTSNKESKDVQIMSSCKEFLGSILFFEPIVTKNNLKTLQGPSTRCSLCWAVKNLLTIRNKQR